VTYVEVAQLIVRIAGDAPRPWLITIGGGVASGKTTTAELLRPLLGDGTVVVNTDGFIFPNAVLESRGLMQRKGFPESYYRERLIRFVRDAKAGAATLTVPLYSHEHYDVVGETVIEQPQTIVLEGLLTETVREWADVSIYLDAQEEDLFGWFMERFHRLRAEASAGSFFDSLAQMPEEQAIALARNAWETINLANLREHIAPTREHATLVIVKGAGHEICRIERREE